MKNAFLVLSLFLAIILCSSQSRVEARDVYVGTYNSGYDAYLMTETVHGTYYCTIKAVSGGDVLYVDYQFYLIRRPSRTASALWRFKNSQGFDNLVSASTPIENNILNYLETPR